MAHVFAITDGTTTITLNQTNGCMVTGFDMNVAEVVFNEVNRTDVNEIERLNVTSTLDLVFTASTIAGIQTLVRNLEILLDKSLLRQNKKNFKRVYLLVTVDGDVAWRSEILYFKLTPKINLFDGLTAKKTEYTLFITRRFYFEGPEKELELSNSLTSATTGGIEIWNHSDGGEDNYVAIAAAQVGGTLPTPVKLTLTNINGSSIGYRNLYLSTNAFSDPTNFTHIIEGESRESGSGTITTSATSSNGNYNLYGFTGTGEIVFALSDTLLEQTQGRWFRLLARLVSWSGTNVFVTPEIRDATGLVTLWTGTEKLLGTSSTNIQDLGSVPLPSGPSNIIYSDMTLVLKVRATGSGQVNIDFIQLTSLDSYQYVIQRGLNIPNDGVITFDGIEGIIHSNGQTIYSNRVGPLYVFPGKNQRIYILYDTSSGSAIAHTAEIQAYIRERRLTI
jgi:hypothetical protein